MKHFLLRTIALLLLMFVFITVNAQHKKVVIDKSIAEAKKLEINPVKSAVFVQELSGEAIIDENSTKWNRSVRNFEKKHEASEQTRQIIKAQTELKRKNVRSHYSDVEQTKNINSTTPVVNTNFEGNWYDGSYPPDNSMAISNGGFIVSAVNSNIDYYNSSGETLSSLSFDDFFNDPSLTSMLYDPVILYDSGADRFFMVVLHGSSSSTSKVLTCFSKTNNPVDGWWVYQLPGNPLSAGNWFDYPKIGISTNEVYITGNLFDNSDIFDQAVIYQMNKTEGYSGSSLNWQYWSGINESPFTLTPAYFGQQGNYGPGLYFVSTDRNGTLPEKYRLYDLTDDIGGSPKLNVYSIDADFSLAGNALQLGSSVELDNGSNRGLNAFYLNGIVHFVFHSEFVNAYNGINYNRITVSSLTKTSHKFGLDGYDYSYPSVASFATTQTDKSVMICFLRSSSAIYPQIRVVNYDNSGNWSSSTLVKAGDSYVDNNETTETRWGDYTRIFRKHNATNAEVWLAGQFGTIRDVSGIGSIHCFDTWIAQIKSTSSDINELSDIKSSFKVFPNPIYEMFNLEFSLENKMDIEISIIDINGKLVKLLYKDIAYKGKNLLSFNKGALTSGIYFLTIKTNLNTIKNEKIIIE